MAITDYVKAYKIGEKEYKYCVSKGVYPYLPVLDEILTGFEVESQVSLGLVQIPLSSVVGTYSAGRTTAFSRNFMPILEETSEFAYKWSELFDSMMEEGLRDPVKAFEFNNKFYIMEGNKRVSVSKYMNAVSIEADVTRVIPKKTDDPECILYYEFLDFYELNGINYVDVTREGGYKKILRYTNHDEETKWSDEDKQDFNLVYTTFAQEFRTKAAGKLSIGAGDAFATFLEIYDYEECKTMSQSEYRKNVQRIWNEFVILDKGDEVKLVLNPTEESQKVALSKMFPMGTPVLKVAFLHDRSVQTSAWTYSHELGRKYIQDVFGDKIETSCVERVDEDTADDVFEAAIAAGNKVIFATTPKLCGAAMRAAANHPEVNILNCSMMHNHKLVRSYYLRMYEAKFISGAIAGALAMPGENIGYLADYPIRGTLAEINAFALGMQMTNPYVKLILEWKRIKNHDYMQRFKENNVRIISALDLNASVEQSREFGLFRILEDGSHLNYCMPVRHWGKLYEELVRSVMRGGYKNDDAVVGDKGLNYFWGFSSEAVDMVYSRSLPGSAVRLLNNLREGIKNMTINPFTGPIVTKEGNVVCDAGNELNVNEIVLIDWLCECIDGDVPDIEAFCDDAKSLVELQGVKEIID